jgi:hypothetical protein
VALPPKLAVTVDIHDRQFGADFVAKLFSEPQHEISIQNRAPNHNIDSKACVDGFDYFKFQFHSFGWRLLQQNRPEGGIVPTLFFSLAASRLRARIG